MVGRRGFVSSVISAILIGTAGCAADGSDGDDAVATDDAAALEILDVTVERTTRTLVLHVTVGNEGTDRTEAILHGEVAVTDGGRYTESTGISVGPGEEVMYDLTFDIDAADSLGSSGYTHKVWLEPRPNQ